MGGGHGGTKAALTGDICKGAVAVIAQQRLAARVLPAAAQHEDVFAAVVIVIGLKDVQATRLVCEPGLCGAVREGAVAVVVIERKRLAVAHVRGDNVRQSIVIEIIHDHPARLTIATQPRFGGHVSEVDNLFFRFEDSGRNQILLGDTGRVLAAEHETQIQQPAHFSVFGDTFQVPLEVICRVAQVFSLLRREVGFERAREDEVLVEREARTL